jgi:hypothetical protein
MYKSFCIKQLCLKIKAYRNKAIFAPVKQITGYFCDLPQSL